ncbi:MAG: oligosaccharide flippase family protein [Acidobacteriota bacterium]|nr:oligosaccharide flippase family protein [Acidobacteriota bacterium]
MGLAFVPLYIKYLGIEAYGLMGLFAVLQAWLGLLDMGMKPTLGREMARFNGGGHDSQSIRNLLRSIEIIGFAIAFAITLGIWAASGWLASNWLKAPKLPLTVVANAFTIMGGVTAMRFLEDIYVSGLAGLERQVEQNVVTSITATARGFGAVAILAWVSPTIDAFFAWQALTSIVSVAVIAVVVYRALPPAPQRVRFSMAALIHIWRFAAGMMAITLLSLLLTQVDKILLSRLLTLEMFGYYALAGTVAGGLYTLTGPITAAFYPRFTALATRRDEIRSRTTYHQGAQWVTVLMGSAAIVLMVFGENVLRLWTGDTALSQQVAPLMMLLVLGTMFNALMWIPYQMMLAHGWTSLTIIVNGAAVGVIVPALLLAVPRFGAIGAAWIWVIANATYLITTIPLMHSRLLPGEKWRWYREDVIVPLAAGALAAFMCRALAPRGLDRFGEFGLLVVSSIWVLLASSFAAPEIRVQLARYLPVRFRFLAARAG